MKNCKEVASLVSQKLDRDLSFAERLHLRMHLVMCFMCRRFSRQIQTVSFISRNAGRTDSDIVDDGLSLEAKARIKGALSGHGRPDSV